MADSHVIVIRVVSRLEQREVDNPSEGELVRVQQTRTTGEFDTHRAQQQLGGFTSTSGEEHRVAVLSADSLLEAVALLVRQVLGDRALQLAVFGELHIGQALRATLTSPLLPCIELSARCRGTTLEQDGTDIRRLEHAERRVLEIVGQLDELVAESQIRLVGTVLVHRILPRDARQRKLDVITAGLPNRLDDLLGHRDDILLVDIAHFHIELRELRLAVSAEVLITVAACELIVAFDAADHEQLLEQLGALRQRIPRTRHQTGRYKEVASAFRGGLDEGRGFHLGEVHVFQRVARSLRHVGTQLQVALHLRTTQIKIPVFQAHVLARQLVLGLVLERSGHLERQGVGLGEHLEILDDDLDLAGGQMRVLVALRAQAHLAGDLDDELAA